VRNLDRCCRCHLQKKLVLRNKKTIESRSTPIPVLAPTTATHTPISLLPPLEETSGGLKER
jgi:hypothetical protein